MNAVVIVWLHLLVNKIMNNSKLKEKLDILYHKYKGLEELYYSLYIDSFSSSTQELLTEDSSTSQDRSQSVLKGIGIERGFESIRLSQSVEHCDPKGITSPIYPLERRCNFLKLYNNFKEVCRLLEIVKQLCEPEGDTISVMLGLGEIKVLTNFKDIRALLDTNDLYPLVYSNHDF
jgi:hypothetical protein